MIDIVMATYNGAKYLNEQLLSISRQTYREWRCLIHDDGSSDSTLSIIYDWVQRDPRFVCVEDEQRGLGAAKNFIHTLQYATASWVMWADQDDIWYDDKIERMLRAGVLAHFQGAGVVYSNAQLWSESKGVISNKNTLYFPRNLREALFQNTGIQGAASLFNTPMRDLLIQPLEYYAMHDHVLLLAALTMGEMVIIDEPMMHYRQHETNVTGHAPGSMRKKWQLMWTNRCIPLVSREHLEGLRAFYEHFQQDLAFDHRHIIQTFLSLPNLSPIQRLITIKKNGFTLYHSAWLLWIKLCIRRFI